jgi:hypothetical protein
MIKIKTEGRNENEIKERKAEYKKERKEWKKDGEK